MDPDQGPEKLPTLRGPLLTHLRHKLIYRLLRGDSLIANCVVNGEYGIYRKDIDGRGSMIGNLYLGGGASSPPHSMLMYATPYYLIRGGQIWQPHNPDEEN